MSLIIIVLTILLGVGLWTMASLIKEGDKKR